MNNQEPDFEKLIGETIEKAFQSGDFTQLKKTLGTTVQNVIQKTAVYGEQISANISNAVSDAQKKQQTRQAQQPQTPVQRVPSRYTTQWQAAPRQVQRAKIRQKVKLPSKTASTVGIFAGLLLGVCFLQGAYQTATDILHGPFKFSMLPSLLILLLLMTGSFCFAAYCTGKFRKRRYQQYLLAIGGRQVCAIGVLAAAVKKPSKYVIRDLRKMIKSGLFPQGHLDDEETCLILTDQAYEQYRVGQANRKVRELQQAKIQENPDGLDAVIAEGQGWIRKIREANDALPGQEISDKLGQLETVTGKIFVCVEKHPEKLPEIRRFMNYYLPTTVKLVYSYREFENQPVQGENIQAAKKEILDILDTVNDAFASLLDGLFQNDAIDISADISVLKTMLAQEGLTQKDFGGQSH
ncbi:MAG: 5-bromo-4-chloroindolyl phosphate hydrolysis family protein [Oscillospiraceae bacterium]|nr:5-bromo-4-chloroindolyl phosphate hydrolysis family protein [Oscillospiraceae bacterium]